MEPASPSRGMARNYTGAAMELILDEKLRERKRAASQLVLGAVLAGFGFLFACFVLLYQHRTERQLNYLNVTFASGNNYWPQTVSESVSDGQSDLGKVFFGCNVVGGMLLLFSNYSWHLRNVYLGDKDRAADIPFIGIRSFAIPCGLMLVATVQMIPHANAGYTEELTNTVHTLAATVLLGGYCFLEARTLGWFMCCPNWVCFRVRRRRSEVVLAPDHSGMAMFSPGERQIRTVLIALCIVGIVLFQVCGSLADKAPGGLCCQDDWVIPPANTIFKKSHILPLEYGSFGKQKKMLLNTAYGNIYKLKVATYFSELIAALLAIISHLVIWWFCPERKFKSKYELLPDVEGITALKQLAQERAAQSATSFPLASA